MTSGPQHEFFEDDFEPLLDDQKDDQKLPDNSISSSKTGSAAAVEGSEDSEFLSPDHPDHPDHGHVIDNLETEEWSLFPITDEPLFFDYPIDDEPISPRFVSPNGHPAWNPGPWDLIGMVLTVSVLALVLI